MGSEVAAALKRAQGVYARRPGAGMHEDSPAMARWEQGLRVVTSHPSGRTVVSDMPTEFGGSGAEITPGWYARAGTAACTATCIALAAELAGVALTRLEVTVRSRSDARGLLAMQEAGGEPVDAAATGFEVHVAIAGAAPVTTLDALAREGCRCSPISLSLARANDVQLRVEVSA